MYASSLALQPGEGRKKALFMQESAVTLSKPFRHRIRCGIFSQLWQIFTAQDIQETETLLYSSDNNN